MANRASGSAAGDRAVPCIIKDVYSTSPVMNQSLAIATTSPSVANLDVTKSCNVHVGPEFVSVTQNVTNTKVVKGRFLGLELVSPKKSNSLQWSVGVFLCWAVIVATALALYVTYLAMPRPMRLDIGLNETWYLRRADWQAMAPYGIDYLSLPASYVVIRHTAANYCEQRTSCIEQMLIIQTDHLRRGFLDIGSNFLVGGNGLVFEGRGANVRPEIDRPWDGTSLSIALMGNYRIDDTRQEQFDHINELLDVLVEEGVLRADYTLYGHCQLRRHTYSPGLNVILRLQKFPHWSNRNLSDCLIR